MASSATRSSMAPRPRSRSASARRSSASRSASVSGSSTYTRQRESSAAFSSKLGFSVVAPISVISPDSTAGRNASCWPRLNRWISSQKKMVSRPSRRRSSASRRISRTRCTPSVTALNVTNSRSVCCAMTRARVVLPEPGGPQRMTLPTSPRRIASPRACPGASRCGWPTTSSSVRGRSRAASGAAGAKREGSLTLSVLANPTLEQRVGHEERRGAAEERQRRAPAALGLELRAPGRTPPRTA